MKLMENEKLSPSVGPFWRWGLLWLVVIAATRALLIVAVYKLTGGKQFTDDMFHYAFLDSPWGIFTGDERIPQSFPPFVPVLVFLIGKPLSFILGEFAVLRATYSVYELLAWLVMVDVMRRCGWSKRLLNITGLVWVIAPILWLSGAVKMQEESISLLFMASIVWACVQSRLKTAIAVCSLGVIAAKIFFLIPLLALAVYWPVRSFKEYIIRGAIAAVPIAIVYAAVQLMTSAGSSVDSFSEFTPPVQQVTTFWALLAKWHVLADTMPETAALAKRYSPFLALAAGLAPLGWLYFMRRRFRDRIALIALMGSMIMAVYSTFYHVNPPYFIIMVPILLIVFRPMVWTFWILVGFSFVWAINLTRGVALARTTGSNEGKASFVRLYDSISPVDADTAHTICLITFMILSVALAIQLFLLADRRVRRLSQGASS